MTETVTWARFLVALIYALAGCLSVPLAVWLYGSVRHRIRYRRFRRGGRSWAWFE